MNPSCRPGRFVGIGLARPAIFVVFALTVPDAQLREQRRPRAVEFRVSIQSRLVGPALEQSQAVRVHAALKDLELLAARLLHHLRAAALVRFRELRPFAGDGGDRHDESDRHLSVSLEQPTWVSGRRPDSIRRDCARWPMGLSRLPRQRDGGAELSRPLGGLDDLERTNAGRGGNRIGRAAAARVEERLELEPQRLLATRRDLFLPGLDGLPRAAVPSRSEEHTSELQSLRHLVCRLLLEKKKKNQLIAYIIKKKKTTPK